MEIKPTLVLTKGKWYVCVTIPEQLRQHYKNQKQIKRSTGTSDIRIAEKKRLAKANEILQQFEKLKGADHPYVKAGQTIIDLTHEVSHGFSAEQLLDSSTAFEAMLDIRNRVEYARRLDWVSSDAEDAISIANVQDRIETALVEFDEQASIYGAHNNTDKPVLRSSNSQLSFM